MQRPHGWMHYLLGRPLSVRVLHLEFVWSTTGLVSSDWSVLQERCTHQSKATCLGLGIRRSMLEPCPFQIQTSLGGTGERTHFRTRDHVSVQVRLDHATDSSSMGVSAVVTSAESYDVLVGGAVLYTMGFQMDYW